MKIYYSFPVLILLLIVLGISAGLAAPVAPPSVQFLPGDDALGPAAFDQMEPAISLGGSQSLVAWTDYRTGGSPLIIDESGADIFAARMDAGGNLLDTTPLLLTMAAGDDTDPKIAWNGENWLVIWLAQTPTQFFWSNEVQAVRVSPAGEVLDETPITVLKYSSSSGAEAEIASDGANWVVVTRGTQADENDILAVRIAPDGTVLDPNGEVLVPGTFSLTFNLDMAFSVDKYLLTYLFMGKVQGLRFGSNLQPIDPFPFTIAAPADSAQSPRVASNNTGFFVFWGEYNNGTQFGQGRGTRVNPAGQVLDPGGLAISGSVFLGVNDPRVVWDGANWVATYKLTNFGGDPDSLLASRITTTGQVLDPGGEEIEPVVTGYAAPEIALAAGGGTRLTWQDNRAGGQNPNDISTFSISQSLSPGPPTVVSFSSPAQTQPDVATSGNGYMLAFRSTISGQHRIKILPFDAQGSPLLPEPIQLDTGTTLADPAVAWNGSLYLVVWSEVGSPNLNNSLVWGQRINPNGSLVDPAPIPLIEGFSTDVAALGDVFLAVGIQQTVNAEVREPFGIRIQGSTGQILDPAPLDLGFSFVRSMAVTAMGDRWLVSYQRNFSHDDPNAEIRATFIEQNAVVSSSFIVASGLDPFLYNPDLASDGTDSLLIWENSIATNPFIQGARVLDNGTVTPLITVNNAPQTQNFPAIAWDGGQYVSLYQDLRNITFFLDERSDIFGTRLAANGSPIDPNGFAVFSSPLPDTDPAVVGANGVSLLAAAVFRNSTPFMAYRINLTLFGDSFPTPTPTLTPTVTPTATATPPPGAGIHVGDLDGSSAPAPRSKWNATVTITVHNQSHTPVANVAVSGNWSAGGTGSGACTTNASGQCSIVLINLPTSTPSVAFSVSNLTLAGNPYNPAANHDPDGDSNGTIITVSQSGPPTPTPTPTATPLPGANIHSGDLDGSSASAPNNRWTATVLITVHNQSHTPVANVAVSGSWSAGGTGSGACTTNASGQCSIVLTGIRTTTNSVAFSVSNLTLAGNPYNPALNHDPDGDSNGTIITVLEP